MTAKLRFFVLLVLALQLSETVSNNVDLLDVFDLTLPSNCNETEYYDSSKLACLKCPDNSEPVDSETNCTSYNQFRPLAKIFHDLF